MALEPELDLFWSTVRENGDLVLTADRNSRPDLEITVKLAADIVRPAIKDRDGILETQAAEPQHDPGAYRGRVFGLPRRFRCRRSKDALIGFSSQNGCEKGSGPAGDRVSTD